MGGAAAILLMKNNNDKISILLFAGLKEAANISRVEMEIREGVKIIDVRIKMGDLYPEIKIPIMKAVASINHCFAFDSEPVPFNAEVAFFPAVSGGQSLTFVQIVEKAFDIDSILEQITSITTGASCIFTGIVRGQTVRSEVKETQLLNYEAYIPMAEEKMTQIAREIRIRWPNIDGIAIIQRVGILKPGTPTVIVACSASHRDSGVFEGARYGIDRLKEIVPIWKKEISKDGESWIEGHYYPQQDD
jgi:molybdopterin synthase catalytic subunit/molybdopterin converting factor small subunit